MRKKLPIMLYYAKDTSMFAISDEKGILFKIKPNISISQWKFSPGQDFEDITRIDSIFYILKSNGDGLRTKESTITKVMASCRTVALNLLNKLNPKNMKAKLEEFADNFDTLLNWLCEMKVL